MKKGAAALAKAHLDDALGDLYVDLMTMLMMMFMVMLMLVFEQNCLFCGNPILIVKPSIFWWGTPFPTHSHKEQQPTQ